MILISLGLIALAITLLILIFFCIYGLYRIIKSKKTSEKSKIASAILLLLLLTIFLVVFGILNIHPTISGIAFGVAIVTFIVFICLLLSATTPVGTVTKYCSACRKTVPNSSMPGQHCPHCGVYWTRNPPTRRR